MDRPLWRLLLPLLLIAAALQRGAAAAMLVLDRANLLGLALALEGAALVAAAVGVFVGGRLGLWTAIAFGVTSALSALIAIGIGGAVATPSAISKLLVAAIGAAALVYLSRMPVHEEDAPA